MDYRTNKWSTYMYIYIFTLMNIEKYIKHSSNFKFLLVKNKRVLNHYIVLKIFNINFLKKVKHIFHSYI